MTKDLRRIEAEFERRRKVAAAAVAASTTSTTSTLPVSTSTIQTQNEIKQIVEESSSVADNVDVTMTITEAELIPTLEESTNETIPLVSVTDTVTATAKDVSHDDQVSISLEEEPNSKRTKLNDEEEQVAIRVVAGVDNTSDVACGTNNHQAIESDAAKSVTDESVVHASEVGHVDWI